MNANTFTPIIQEKDLCSLRLCKRICFDRERIYELLCDGVDGQRFFFSVKEGDEQEVKEVVCSFSDAAALFDRIVFGHVPPYVLGEILEDFTRDPE